MDRKKVPWAILAMGGLLASLHFASHAADVMSLELASGSQTKMVRIGFQWKWERQWLKSSRTHIGGYWDISVAQWRAGRSPNPDARRDITVLGLTPVFRLQMNTLRGFYGEIGIGANYLSDLYDVNGRTLSTRFQFGDHIGVGYVFENDLDIGLRIQHFSNGSIKRPNDGLNFAIVRVSYPF